MGQPGEKIDLSTFIAYLLPGLIVQFVLFALVDSIYLIMNRESLVPIILSILLRDVIYLLAVGAVLIFLGYFLGLLIAYILIHTLASMRRIEKMKPIKKSLVILRVLLEKHIIRNY